jgi:hypothetical protein
MIQMQEFEFRQSSISFLPEHLQYEYIPVSMS